MNSKIQDIIEQTGIEKMRLGYHQVSSDELEEFAKLIVRECIAMSSNQNQYKLGFQLAKEFKERFEVE